MTNYKDYLDYFENLCVQYEDLEHDPDNNIKGFFRINIEETITGIRGKIEADGIFFVLTDYTWKPIDAGREMTREIQMMFLICGKHKNQDFEDETNVRNRCEVAMIKFLNRIKLDSQKETGQADDIFFKSQDLLKIDNILPVSNFPGKNHVGWQCVFTINPFYNHCVNKDDWADLLTDEDAKPY